MEFFHTHVSPQAIDNAVRVLRSCWLSEGRIVRELESRLEQGFGLSHPVALNSGTSALHLALAIIGVGPGDQVILPAQTFVATGLAILMQSGEPVFADINPLTGNISPERIISKITDKTKAIIPVHWGGYPCDMDEITMIAREHGAIVIEDAAHALGASYKGTRIGAVSRFTAFSFQAIKHMTTGDGGALCCKEWEDAHTARVLRWFGIDREHSEPSLLGERVYDIDRLGFKYHMNDLAASVGIGNLDDLPERLARRRWNARVYRRELAGVPGLQLLKAEQDRESSCWLFTVLVERREEFIRKLKAHGIPASVVHLRIDHNSIFGGLRDDLPGQEEFNLRQIAIPVHEGLSVDDIRRVVAVIRSGW